MGANAQTTVPSFTSGEVLTADQQNQSARTGVPVFADTSARDAAFGGLGEKVLAEGQLAYLENTNVVQYYDGSAWATLAPQTQKIVQIVTASTTTDVISSTTTFVDTTLTATISPTSASNNILIVVTHNECVKNAGNALNRMKMRLVRGSTSIQTITTDFLFTNSSSTLFASLGTQYLDSPATTSATTYKTQFANGNASSSVQVQANAAGTSFITLYEVAP